MTNPTGARPPRRPEADARRSPPPLPIKSAALAKKSGAGLVLLGSTVGLLAVATCATIGVAIWWKAKKAGPGPIVAARLPVASTSGSAASAAEPTDAGDSTASNAETNSDATSASPPGATSSPTDSSDTSASSDAAATSDAASGPSSPSSTPGPVPTGPGSTGPPTPVVPAAPENTGPTAPSGGQPVDPTQAFAPRPFDDIRRQGGCLTVPPLAQARGKRVELAKIHVDKPTDCTLTLHAPSALIPSPAGIELREADEGERRSWRVTWNTRPGAHDGAVICILSLENQKLSCEWPSATLPPAADLWRWSLLEFKAAGDTEVANVRPVEEVVLAPWTWKAGRTSIRLPFAVGALAGHAGLRLKIDPTGLQGAQLTPPQPMATTETATLEWSDPAMTFDGRATPLTVKLQPKWNGGELQLELVCFCDLPEVDVDYPNLRDPKKAGDLRLSSKKVVGARKVADPIRAAASAKRATERLAELRDEVTPRVAAARAQVERLEQRVGMGLNTPLGAVTLAEARQTLATLDGLERQIDAVDLDLENWIEWATALESSYAHMQKPDSLQFELVTTLAGKDVTLYRAVAGPRP